MYQSLKQNNSEYNGLVMTVRSNFLGLRAVSHEKENRRGWQKVRKVRGLAIILKLISG